jgi:uncharacterized RDD family membrane protein YckC
VSDVSNAAADRAAYSGFWRRFAAWVIDCLVISIGSAVLRVVAPLVGVADNTRFWLVLAAAYFLYCTLLESSPWQASVGKRAFGLKVTNEHGDRIGFARAAARFVAKLLSVLTLCLGYLLIVVTKRRQALHDLIAGTLVARDAALPRPAWLVSAAACVPLVFVVAGMALPTYQDYATREQVNEGLALADGYRLAIESLRRNSQQEFAGITSDSLGPGLPERGRYVESIEVVSGVIVITYGGEASAALSGSVLAIVPALDANGAMAWACGYGNPPAGFEAVFEGHGGYSDIEERFLPYVCRSAR